MIDKARCAKHVSNLSLIKFSTITIRKEKVPQKISNIIYNMSSKGNIPTTKIALGHLSQCRA